MKEIAAAGEVPAPAAVSLVTRRLLVAVRMTETILLFPFSSSQDDGVFYQLPSGECFSVCLRDRPLVTLAIEEIARAAIMNSVTIERCVISS
jgi:hypothetical protein